MMKDIEIKINRETRMVDLSKSIIGNDGENLQGNLVFSFTDDFVKGQGRLEYVTNKEKKYALLLKGEDNYYIPIKSVMTKEGQIDMQLVVTEGTDENEIPIFKSNVFYVTCKGSINAEIEEEEGYYQWIEIANTKLNEVDEAIEELTSQSDYAKEQGDYAKEQGTNAKNIAEETEKKAEDGLFNGKSLEFVWQGTKLGVRLEGQEEYQFVDLQGVQGEIGATGEPFKIKKTYGSVSEMNADFGNMQFGDYVMIASSVEVEDNAKLYTRGESAWIFISDFSGAMGIRGETGLTPNIKIGEVKTLEAGSQAKVTRSGSNEEPVFNFEIPKGDKGDDYVLTEEDKIEIGEKVNTEYEKRIAENEKDIVDLETYLDTITPKSSAKGELVHITDALPLATFETTADGNVEQETTKGNQLIDLENPSWVNNATYDKTTKIYTTNSITGNYEGFNIFTTPTPIIIPKGESTFYYSCDLKLLSGTYSNKLNLIREGTANENLSFNVSGISNPTLSSSYQRYIFKVDYNNTSDTEIKAANYFVQLGTNATEAVLELKNLMISKQDVPYEPYTGGQASPNPEYKQPIEVIEGSVEIANVSNNRFDGKLELGNINIENGTNIISDTFVRSTNYLLIKGFKSIYAKVNNSNSYLIGYRFYDKQKRYLGRATKNETFDILNLTAIGFENKTEYFNSIDDICYLRFIVMNTTDTNLEIMVSKTAQDYEEYQEQIVPLDLKGNWVGAINNNVKDYLVTDKKKYWLVKNVRKYVVTGNEEFNMYTLNGITIFRFSFNEIKSFNQRILCCNYFTFQDNGITKTNCISNRYGNFYNVEFSINGYSTIDEFKAFLKEKYNSGSPVEFLYITKKTEIIELGKLPEPIKTFDGTNDIQLLANLDTEIETTYALDLKKYYDNKLAEISAQII